jgi:hypothetical protein
MPLKSASIAGMSTRRSALASTLASALTLCCAGHAWAQASYPDKAMRVIVPQPPGRSFDFVSRVLAERLGKLLGQSVVVENRPGSGTLVGTDLAAKAASDGTQRPVPAVAQRRDRFCQGQPRQAHLRIRRQWLGPARAGRRAMPSGGSGAHACALPGGAARLPGLARDWTKLVRDMNLKPE